jgi:hypothetical protein
MSLKVTQVSVISFARKVKNFEGKKRVKEKGIDSGPLQIKAASVGIKYRKHVSFLIKSTFCYP